MTVSISFTNPVAGQVIARDRANTFTWTRSVTQQGTPQSSACILRLRPYGTATWTYTQTGVAGTSFVVPAGTITSSGSWEAQVVYTQDVPYDTGSATVVFTALLASATPTISAPTSPVTNPTATVTWATSPTTQYSAQVQVMNGATVVWDSGEVVQTAQTMVVPFPDTGVTRQVRVRIKRDNSATYTWGDWATTGNLTVTHLPPPTPTVTAFVASDMLGVGVNYVLQATISTPAPAGGAPAVSTTEVYLRLLGDTSDGVLMSSLTGAAGSWRYNGATVGRTYQVRVRNVSSDGRYAYSAWVTHTGTITIRGALLSDTGGANVDANGMSIDAKLFRLNGDGATETRAVESALLDYDGREFPVMEFGTGGSHVIELRSVSVRTSAEYDTLLALAATRRPICYRDKRGRKVYGLLEVGPIEDTFFGNETSLKITRIDYPADRVA